MVLVLIDDDPKRAEEFRRVFGGNGQVQIQEVESVRWLNPPAGLDVVYLPSPAAERWGSVPVIDESQILSTTAEDQKNGMTNYVVTGPCLSPTDARGPLPETRLLIGCVLEAVRKFNSSNSLQLQKIGFWSENLTRGVTPEQVKRMFYELSPELRPSGGK